MSLEIGVRGRLAGKMRSVGRGTDSLHRWMLKLSVGLLVAALVLGLRTSRLTAEGALPSVPLSEEESFDFTNSRAQAVLIGRITRLESVLDRSRGAARMRTIIHVTPEEWIRPRENGREVIRIEATSNRLERALPMRDGELSSPVRALLFLRAIPEGNTTLMRGLRWGLPAERVGIPNGIKIIDDLAGRDQARALVERSSARLSPEGMAVVADLVLTGVRQAGIRACLAPFERLPCASYRVGTILKGSILDSLVTVYADPPRSLPNGGVVLFLSSTPSGEFRVLNTGYGCFAVNEGAIPELGMTVAELRSVVHDAPHR